MRYQRLANGRWVHADGKTFHKHDVRAMAAYESEQLKLVVSGGIFVYFVIDIRYRSNLFGALASGPLGY
jgi:hypothetical protein